MKNLENPDWDRSSNPVFLWASAHTRKKGFSGASRGGVGGLRPLNGSYCAISTLRRDASRLRKVRAVVAQRKSGSVLSLDWVPGGLEELRCIARGTNSNRV